MVSAKYLTLLPVALMPPQNLAKTGPDVELIPAVKTKSDPSSPKVRLSSVSPK